MAADMVALKLRLRLAHLCLGVVLASMAISCCRGQGGGGGGAGAGAGGAAGGAGAGGAAGGAGGGAGGAAGGAVVPGTQDAVQIVSQAALCFDNRQVINGCLQAMGINVNGTGGSSNSSGGSSNGGSGSGGGSSGGGVNGAGSASSSGNSGGSTAIMCQGPCFGHMMLMMTCVNGILGNIQGYSPGLMQGVQAVFQMSCGNVGNGQQGAAGGGAGGGVAGAAGAAGGVGAAGGAGSGGAAGVSSGAGAGGGGASGAGGVAGGAGNAVGASGGSNTANSDITSGSTTPNARGSHVAAGNPDEPQPTSSANGPMASLTSRFPSMLWTWTCIWLLRLLWL